MVDEALQTDRRHAAIVRAERRLPILEKMALAGSKMIDILEPGPETTPEEVCDRAPAFAHITRALRLTFAMEAKTDRDLIAWSAGPAAEEKPWAPDRPRPPSQAYVDTFRERACEGIDREAESDEDCERLLAELDAALAEEGALNRWDVEPMGLQLWKMLCARLEIYPDLNKDLGRREPSLDRSDRAPP